MSAPQYNEPAWIAKRDQHLALPDNDRCIVCGESYGVDVHHRLYRTETLPWPECIGHTEHPDDLVTLCRTHHRQLHDEFRLVQMTDIEMTRLSRELAEFVARLKATVPTPVTLESWSEWFIMRGILQFMERIGAFDAIASSELADWTVADCAERSAEFVQILNAEIACRNVKWRESTRPRPS